MKHVSTVTSNSFTQKELPFRAVTTHIKPTTHIRRQLISGDNSYQATTHIRRQFTSSNISHQSKLISEN